MSLTVCDTKNEQCMIRQCKDYPGNEKLVDYLQTYIDEDDIVYNQWVSTLTTIIQTKYEFIEKLVTSIISLSRHSFTAKAQSEYMQSLKDNLSEDQIIIQMDFSENYSYVLQDEIQSYHWENAQCTLHPIVSYMNIDGEVVSNCACILSDHKSHSTAAVHCFLRVVFTIFKNYLPFSENCSLFYRWFSFTI